jgi:2-hydroxy-6-oxonona-2,4-dienedioate hydrolase
VGAVRSEWNVVRGRRLHVRTAGTHGRPVLVLVHGLGVSSLYFVPLMRSLSRDFLVLAPDLAGFGRSETPAHVLTLAGLAAELRAFLDVRNIERAAFLGNSMGCQVLLELAVAAPERVDRLIFVGPTVDPRFRSFGRQIPRWLLEASREPLSTRWRWQPKRSAGPNG